MKFVVVLGDGMADEPMAVLHDKTPLEVARKPLIDTLCQQGELGMVNTIPEGMKPGSDTANLSVMGYDPKAYYTGRSPLEAVSMGITLEEQDICFRCNLVTVTDDDCLPYWEKKVIDHSADEITSEEAKELIEAVQVAFGSEDLQFYPGVSYRHAMVLNASDISIMADMDLTPPHDILEQQMGAYKPKGPCCERLSEMMVKSYQILKNHPVNQARRENGLRPANSIWIWGEGKKPMLPNFKDVYHKVGAVISAVDLLKGIAIAAGMDSIDVDGATGNLHTNYSGKVKACLNALEKGADFVYLHIEAPDECGHRGEVDNKVLSIEHLENQVVKPLVEGLKTMGDYRLMFLPDHPTPLRLRTHTNHPVPYMIYDSRGMANPSGKPYDERTGASTGIYKPVGHALMQYFFDGGNSC